MFFLATIDPDGFPDVSYKGGMPGFVRAGDSALAFPNYDGNGMYKGLVFSGGYGGGEQVHLRGSDAQG